MRFVVLLLIVLTARSATLDEKLNAYRAELDAFRAEFGDAHELPNIRFFIFGMGLRPKYLYREGKLTDLKTGKVVREWKIKSDVIFPPEYRVVLTLEDGKRLQISEDEQAIWINENAVRASISKTDIPIHLPLFDRHKYSRVLRVLHQELLVNVTEAGPVPNFLVYRKPWYRDAAMMGMVFQHTGNIRQIRNWIMALRDPFDRNNAGETEPDNLGQALYLISLGGDKKHRLVPDILIATKRFEEQGVSGRFIKGRTDFGDHPVYQTKWLKYGLRSLSLKDPFAIPELADSYSALFWMDYRDSYVITNDANDREKYPYLGWASDHFHGTKKSPIGNRDYPLTWEQNASQANYAAMAVLDPLYVEQKLATPHTWQAAEILLYLLDPK